MVVALALTVTVSPALAAVVNKYTFNDGTANDSVGGANATLFGTNGSITGGQLVLANTGEGSAAPGTAGAYLDIPNFTIRNAAISGASKPVTVGLDGPVEAIKDNLVTVNGIPVWFDPGDPILKTLTAGNFVSVKGNFSGSGASIVLVVVNVTVFNNITVINNNCWFDPGPMHFS